MKETEINLHEVAKMLTWINPEIKVLGDDANVKHNALVQVIEQVLQNENFNKTLLLPELKKHTDSLAIFSDYGGESKGSKYFTYSFLICDLQVSKHFIEKGMADIRNNFSLGDKEIAFKDLRHGPTKRSLESYLELLDKSVPGFLYTVVIDKKVNTIFDAPQKKTPKEAIKLIEEYGFGKWKPNVAEKMLRIVHIVSYLVALFSKDGQEFFWMTDHDAIAPNPDKHINMLNLLANILPSYTKTKFNSFSGAVPFDERSIGMLDLLSSTDLVAGAIEHYLTRSDNTKYLSTNEDADKILQWLSHDGIALKKRTTVIRPEGDSVLGSNLVFELKDLPENVTMVPVAM